MQLPPGQCCNDNGASATDYFPDSTAALPSLDFLRSLLPSSTWDRKTQSLLWCFFFFLNIPFLSVSKYSKKLGEGTKANFAPKPC